MQRVPVVSKKGRIAVADSDMPGSVLDLLYRLDVVAESLEASHHQQGLKCLFRDRAL